MATDPRRHLPAVDRLANELADEAPDLPRPVIVDAVRTVVDAFRTRATRAGNVPAADEVRAAARDEIRRRRRRRLRPVVNATGVVVHTNLGRAPLSQAAIDAVVRVARGYANLEFDLETGRRGDRFVHVEPLVAVATGAQAALVVNNNASAVLLVCAALAFGREVVISRGELIEIGGSFRIPDVLSASGAILREVGTTNRTHLRDYEGAITDDTALVMSVHPSNYRIVGFTKAPGLDGLVRLAHARGVPLVLDAGSGLLARPFADEPVVSDAISSGADLVCFSGDKLLGGPQAGIICGRRDLLDRLRTHPLLRALRPDKMTLAALEATVSAYLDGDEAALPVWGMLDADRADLERRTRAIAEQLEAYEAEIGTGGSVPGGGSLPGHEIPSPVLTLRHPDIAPADVVARLRGAEPPVVARIEDDAVVIDLRTVDPEHDEHVTAALLQMG